MQSYQGDSISLHEVTKVFKTGLGKKHIGIHDLSLSVPAGEIVGLLGPNGSGKSTTIKMILGFLKPTSGTIHIAGRPSTDRLSRANIGYLPENPRFQKFLTASAILTYLGKLLGLSTAEISRRKGEVLELVGLRHAENEPVQGFSKGMTQRLAIAQAILNRPTLLIFDEPMSGLDPIGRVEIRHLISNVHRESPQTTIFFSSHVLADVEELCSRVALLRQGRLQLSCPLEDLLSKGAEIFHVVARDLPKKFPQKLIAWKKASTTASGVSLRLEGVPTLMKQLEALKASGATVVSISTERRTLEQTLFSGKETREKKAA